MKSKIMMMAAMGFLLLGTAPALAGDGPQPVRAIDQNGNPVTVLVEGRIDPNKDGTGSGPAGPRPATAPARQPAQQFITVCENGRCRLVPVQGPLAAGSPSAGCPCGDGCVCVPHAAGTPWNYGENCGSYACPANGGRAPAGAAVGAAAGGYAGGTCSSGSCVATGRKGLFGRLADRRKR